MMEIQSNIKTATRYINEKEAAMLTGMSVAWLQRSRWRGGINCIPFVKCGSRVLYDIKAIESFLAQRIKTSTSDQGHHHLGNLEK
jgi:hypothetical protein